MLLVLQVCLAIWNGLKTTDKEKRRDFVKSLTPDYTDYVSIVCHLSVNRIHYIAIVAVYGRSSW